MKCDLSRKQRQPSRCIGVSRSLDPISIVCYDVTKKKKPILFYGIFEGVSAAVKKFVTKAENVDCAAPQATLPLSRLRSLCGRFSSDSASSLRAAIYSLFSYAQTDSKLVSQPAPRAHRHRQSTHAVRSPNCRAEITPNESAEHATFVVYLWRMCVHNWQPIGGSRGAPHARHVADRARSSRIRSAVRTRRHDIH